MKRKGRIAIFIAILMVFSIAIVGARTTTKGQYEFSEMGKGIRDSVSNLILSEQSEDNRSSEYYMGEVEGEKISKLYFEVRYASYRSSPLNYENPKDEAWNSIIQEYWEKHFAKENGISVSEKEIDEYITYVKDGYHETKEGELLIEALVKGMGMSENEYWEYNKQYQAPLALLHEKIEKYLSESKTERPDTKDIQSRILDQQYYDSLS